MGENPFDENGSILWQRVLSKPHKVAGGWYNAAGRDAYIVPEGVVFTTINTFNRANWQIPHRLYILPVIAYIFLIWKGRINLNIQQEQKWKELHFPHQVS